MLSELYSWFYWVQGGAQTCEPRSSTRVTAHASWCHGGEPPRSVPYPRLPGLLGSCVAQRAGRKVTRKGLQFLRIWCEQSRRRTSRIDDVPPTAGEAGPDGKAGGTCTSSGWRSPIARTFLRARSAIVVVIHTNLRTYPVLIRTLSYLCFLLSSLFHFRHMESSKSTPRLEWRQSVPTAEPLWTTRTTVFSYNQNFS